MPHCIFVDLLELLLELCPPRSTSVRCEEWEKKPGEVIARKGTEGEKGKQRNGERGQKMEREVTKSIPIK